MSLIREHTAAIRPPRALWVPFELGRPFGPPGEPAFQLDVLRTALGLLEAKSGPLLQDYGREAPGAETEGEAWSCTLPLPARVVTEGPAESLRERLGDEIRALRPWYDEALRRNGRTGFGISGLTADSTEAIADTLATVASGGEGAAPEGAVPPMPILLRYLSDDLKAYYFEAAAAQPASRKPTTKELNRWLFGESVFGEVLYAARDVVSANPDPAQALPGRFFVPAAFARRI